MNFLHLPVGAQFTIIRENNNVIYTKVNDNKHNNAKDSSGNIFTIFGQTQVSLLPSDPTTKDFDLKLIRERKHITRVELAKQSGVHVQTIEKLETNKNNPYDAKMSTLIKLATALHCKVKDFYPCEKVI